MELRIGCQKMVSFKYAGALQSLPCLVEDFVFDDLNTTANQLINAGLNNLFGEINWFILLQDQLLLTEL